MREPVDTKIAKKDGAGYFLLHVQMSCSKLFEFLIIFWYLFVAPLALGYQLLRVQALAHRFLVFAFQIPQCSFHLHNLEAQSGSESEL